MIKFLSNNNGHMKSGKPVIWLAAILLIISMPYKSVSQNCSISDVTAAVVDCINGEFFVVLNFNYANTSDSFHVNGNGMEYGDFAYGSVPITLGPLTENSTPYEFVVMDNVDPDCQDFIDLGVVDCDSSGVCEIGIINVDFDECTSDSTYRIILDFDYANTSNVGFDLWANGEPFGFYSYTNLPLTIHDFPLGDGMTNGVLICDNDNPNCCEDASWSTPNCGSTDNCSIGDLTAQVVDCINGEFFVILNFNYDDVSDSFHVNGNGMEYGNFAYGNVPVTLGPFEENATFYEFVVIDNGHPDCQDFIDLGVVACDTTGVCEIGIIDVDFVECTSDSTYRININFDYANTSNVGFDLWANGEPFGFYSYDDLPISIGNFPLGDGMTNGLLICDNDNSNCCQDASWPRPNCGGNNNCHIWDLIAEVFDCENGEFSIDIDFNHENTSDSFEIRGNGLSYGFFSYNDIPITLGPLPADLMFYEFIITDIGIPDCTEDINLGMVSCDSNQVCNLFDLNVNIGDCTSDTTYIITLDFEYTGTTNNFFDLFANGEFFGFYEFTDLPLTISSFPLASGSVNFLTICENDNPDCCIGQEWTAPNCAGGPTCEMDDLVVEEFDCNANQYYLEIDFNYAHVGDSFKVRGNGHLYGIFSYNDLPIVIGPLSTNSIVNELVVMDLTHPDCMESTTLHINCGGNCHLSELEVMVGEIVSDSTFELTFNFDYINTSDSFHAYSGNMFIGTFAYADLPITIAEFPTRNLPFELLRVCDVNHMDCCAVIEFPVNDGENCLISDATAEVVECDGDTVYALIDFNIQDGSSTGFEIIGNGNNYGTFHYNQLPVMISFIYQSGDFVDLIIRDLANPTCLGYTFIDDFDCTESCELNNLSTTFEGCSSDSTYHFLLDLNGVHTSGFGFDLWANGEFFEFYEYGNLPVFVEHFPSSGANFDTVLVCDNDNADCCAELILPVPSCITGLQGPDQKSRLKILTTADEWEIQVSEPGLISIYDVAGRVMRAPFDIEKSAHISNLISGVYYVTWTGWWGTVSKKAVFFN
jgi:hypothetical protein